VGKQRINQTAYQNGKLEEKVQQMARKDDNIAIRFASWTL
jgi:hypothetical protein